MSPMWYQIFVPMFLPVLVKSLPANKSDDVFIVSAGHAEAEDRYMKHNVILTTAAPSTDRIVFGTYRPRATPKVTPKEEFEYVTEQVVFIPNSRADEREYEREEESIKLGEVMNYKSVDDVLNKKVEKETEAPNHDIYFVTGKNHDVNEEDTKPPSRRRNNDNGETKKKVEILNCKDVDCTSEQQGVCGEKLENDNYKYRMFMNECYFRKVNCQFKHEFNRYTQVPLEKCKDLSLRFIDSHFSSNNKYTPAVKKKEEPKPIVAPPSRRSMSYNVNGQACSHNCPMRCTEDYDPQCAMSPSGHRRVFMNHCKMDYNSCAFGNVWHKRPLAECVGGKKADMQQNRGFIGWMQRVGIVDNRGRLALN